MRTRHPYLETAKPVILAHQGDSLRAPANTMPAFELALANGADILETDLHWTKDGVMVLCHDETVDRTSDGSGRIRDMTLRELRRLDFGYRFSPDGGRTYPFRGRGVRIPTLREVLTRWPGVRVNVDVKPRQPHSLRQLVREIHECKAASRVLIASFHSHVLRRFRTIDPHIATSASTCEVARFLTAVWAGRTVTKVQYCALQVPVSVYGLPVVTQRFVDLAHRARLAVHVWTVDDEREMVRLLDMGVDGIVTNRPAAAARTVAMWVAGRTSA